MKLSRNASLILTALLLSLMTAVGATADDADSVNWDNATAPQVHQRMAESKARAYFDRRYYDRVVAAQALANTQTNYDVLFYDIRIKVDDSAKLIYGRVECVAKATQPSVSEVQVDLFDNMTIDSITSASGQLSYSRASNVVTVTLDRAYNADETFTLTTYYYGLPTTGGFQAFAFGTRSGKKIITSLSEPYYSRTWWPCKDRNDDKADSFKIAIEVMDSSLYVGSNGSLDSVVTASAKSKTFYYTEHYPMVNYLFSVAISPYTVWHQQYYYNGGADSMLITHAVYSDKYSYSLTRWGITPTAIGYLAQEYGEYPYITEKYGHSNFQWGGGMEHQTMTSMVGDANGFGFREDVVVHELSHQWVGDLITCKSWHDIWLNEGWATYSEALYYLHKGGWGSYHAWVNSMDYDHVGTVYVYDTTRVDSIFSSTVYDRGGWVVHMLRRVIGETNFKAFLTAYMNSPYRFGSLTSQEFEALVESVSGMQLDWFFNEWLYGLKRPNYNWAYYVESAPGGGYDTWIMVSQIQTTSPQVYKMPIDFGFDFDSSPSDTVKLMNDARRNMFKVHTTDHPWMVQLDPDGWILKKQTLLSWNTRIVSASGDLAEGRVYRPYRDTVVSKGGVGPFEWTVTSGALPGGLSIDSLGVISGTPTDSGTFNFTLKVRDTYWGYTDEMALSMHIQPGVLIAGDVNMSQDITDLSDLTALVSYLTGGGYVLPNPATADVNNDCIVNLVDLSVLVSYLTGSGATLELGCAH